MRVFDANNKVHSTYFIEKRIKQYLSHFIIILTIIVTLLYTLETDPPPNKIFPCIVILDRQTEETQLYFFSSFAVNLFFHCKICNCHKNKIFLQNSSFQLYAKKTLEIKQAYLQENQRDKNQMHRNSQHCFCMAYFICHTFSMHPMRTGE